VVQAMAQGDVQPASLAMHLILASPPSWRMLLLVLLVG
jgi:hypothetical protein